MNHPTGNKTTTMMIATIPRHRRLQLFLTTKCQLPLSPQPTNNMQQLLQQPQLPPQPETKTHVWKENKPACHSQRNANMTQQK